MREGDRGEERRGRLIDKKRDRDVIRESDERRQRLERVREVDGKLKERK